MVKDTTYFGCWIIVGNACNMADLLSVTNIALKVIIPTMQVPGWRLFTFLFIFFSLTACADSKTADDTGSLSPSQALKISTREEGVYQLTSDQLELAGWGQIDPQSFRLYSHGEKVPILIDEQGSSFRLLFYAQPYSTRYSNTNVFWLRRDEGIPSWIELAELAGLQSQGEHVDSYTATSRFEENLLYAPQVERGDPFLWSRIPAPGNQEFDFSLDGVASGYAELRLEVWASTGYPDQGGEQPPDHHLRISLNKRLITDISWAGRGRFTVEADIPDGILVTGVNRLQIEAPGDTGATVDITHIDWFELDYSRRFASLPGGLIFKSTTDQDVYAEFSGEPSILDISDPGKVMFYSGLSDADGNMRFTVIADHRYLLFDRDSLFAPLQVQPYQPAQDLRSTQNTATYLAIGSPELLEVLQPLLDLRQEQGLRPMAVNLQAVYDQFNNGIIDPEAIRAFLSYAVHNWTDAPEYVLLVGDYSYDPLGFLGEENPDRLPSFMVNTEYGGETASDVEFAFLDDDKIPDISLGRIPTSRPERLRNMVEKILHYETSIQPGIWQTNVLAVADGQEARFASDASRFLESFTDQYQTSLYNPPAGAQMAEQELAEYFNRGNLVVAYFGHGSLNQWGKDRLFTVESTSLLTNDASFPFVINMTCLTGLFTHPTVESLAESMLFKEGGGAVAILAPTSLTLPTDQGLLSEPLVAALVSNPDQPIGKMLLAAQRSVSPDTPGSLDVLRTYLLFGDPAMKLSIKP